MIARTWTMLQKHLRAVPKPDISTATARSVQKGSRAHILSRVARIRGGLKLRRDFAVKGFLDIGGHSRSIASQPSTSVLRVSEEVRDALAAGKPVVALETAIVTHGMPEPHNIDVAHMVEGRIRENGAVPATVGLMDGKVVVGLTPQELRLLASASQERTARKVSRRDLAAAIAEKAVGGTTVSTTMMAAHWAGIDVFVTGGIGGVHRDGENSLDVSADLTELGRTPVAVVCAGCKSILDIGRTLEYLETQGVPTITFGEDKNFPAFFAPDSGFEASHRVASAEACARIILASQQLQLQSGLVVGVPIPSDEGKAVEAAIQQALEEARAENVAGRNVTPFVLRRVNELSAGKSLAANVELIKNNASVGSRIAAELSRLQGVGHGGGGGRSLPWPKSVSDPEKPAARLPASSASSLSSSRPSGSAAASDGVPAGDRRASFACPPPPNHLGSRFDGGGEEPMTQGNSPPMEYVNAVTHGTASSIDNDITAEFENLVPRDYRHADACDGGGGGGGRPTFTPGQTVRRYHTTVAWRRPGPAGSPSSSAQEAQRAIDEDHFAERKDDFLHSTSAPRPVVVGAAVVDVIARPTDADIKLRMTNNCQVSTGFGGVGRNVFEAMSRCSQHPLFISAVGAGDSRASLLQHMDSFLGDEKWCTVGVRPCPQHSTATYMAVLQRNGDLFTGIGNFDVVECISPDWLSRFDQHLRAAPVVVMDSNLTSEAIEHILATCSRAKTPVWFEPTCPSKAAKIYSTSAWRRLTVASPNLAELQSMARACCERTSEPVARETQTAMDTDASALKSPVEKNSICVELGKVLLPHHPCLLVTLDKDGVLLMRRQYGSDGGDQVTTLKSCLDGYAQRSGGDETGAWQVSCHLYNLPTPVSADSIVSVSGAGDSFVGAVVAAILDDAELTISESMELGLRAARTSLPVSEAINPKLSLELAKCGR